MRTAAASELAQVVASSELLGTVPRAGGQRFASYLGLKVLDLPFETPTPNISMAWHERTHKAAGARWFREAVRRCGAWE